MVCNFMHYKVAMSYYLASQGLNDLAHFQLSHMAPFHFPPFHFPSSFFSFDSSTIIPGMVWKLKAFQPA